jgi:hypothetical protein
LTELPTTPIETTPRPSRTRSRRRLIIGIAAAVVAALAVLIGSQVAPSPVKANAVLRYTSKGEQYSVRAPGKATREQADLAGMIPATETHWTDGKRYYSVSSIGHADVPPSQRGFFLNAVLVGALKDAPGVTASSLKSSAVTDAFLPTPKKITLSGSSEPAFLNTITLNGAPAPFDIVFAGHGTTLYMLVYSEPADSHDKDFITSFAFLN